MAISKEVIKRIVGFIPAKDLRGKGGVQRIELGTIGDRLNLAHDVVSYQQRIVGLPDQPKTPDWTAQPSLVVEVTRENGEVRKRQPLVYAADVLALDPDLAAKVADRISVIETKRVVAA